MNIYTAVTERILNHLEAGTVPWRKTWTTGLPRSLSTGREYRGINVLVLGLANFSSRYWVTFREAQRFGGHIRKGERATTVYYWHWRTEEDLARLAAKSGRKDFAPCVAFASSVFNLEQVEGLEPPADEVYFDDGARLGLAEGLVDVMPDKPEIVHSRTQHPCYLPDFDRVIMPHLGQFRSGADYYQTLFHELTHATQSEKRLNRTPYEGEEPNARYSFEELVAEFGAAFLCGFAGLSCEPMEAASADYIRGWSEVFRRDPRILCRAASAAQKAADYIRGKLIVAEELAA